MTIQNDAPTVTEPGTDPTDGPSTGVTLTDGAASRTVRADLIQFDPSLRDTSPSGIAFQPTGGGRRRTSRVAQMSSGTSIRTKNRFQGSVAPRPKCARVSQAASEIDVAA